MRLQYLWHTDNWCITLEEPQLKALHGKKLKINVRLGERRQANLCPAHALAETCPAGSQHHAGQAQDAHRLQRTSKSGALPGCKQICLMS